VKSLHGGTKRESVRNIDIRSELGETNVKETTLPEEEEDIVRTPPPGYPWQALFYRLTGVRDVGRPRRRWTDQF
jgi:hypothetical protein